MHFTARVDYALRAGLILIRRGAVGGCSLARPAGRITLADLATGELPPHITDLVRDPATWK